MRLPAPRELLELWERGAQLHPLDQGLLALRIAHPHEPPQAVADWPLGKRNRALLELHSDCFGSRLQAWVECAACGEKMEFEVEAGALLDKLGVAAQEATVEVRGQLFRLPTSRDLARAAEAGDPAAGAIRLFESCAVGALGDIWSEEDLRATEVALANADPLAEIRLVLTCPGCCEAREEAVDPITFVWRELEALAKRLMHDVHTLAAAYGWSEQEILELSDFRRAQYVQRVNA